MATLIATRGAQFPITAEFTFNFDDTMLNTSGVSADFKTVATQIFDVINLPPNAIVIGGEVVTETAITGSTAYNLTVGDSTSANRYMAVTDKKAAGRTALTLTGYVGVGEQIRLTVTPTVADATAGKVTVRVMYVIRGRANVVQTN